MPHSTFASNTQGADFKAFNWREATASGDSEGKLEELNAPLPLPKEHVFSWFAARSLPFPTSPLAVETPDPTPLRGKTLLISAIHITVEMDLAVF